MIRRLHSLVWRGLPRGFRRRLLVGAARIATLGFRDQASANGDGPITIAGALTTASGLGEGARLCHAALAGAGMEVNGLDLSRTLMAPDDNAGFSFAPAPAHQAGTAIIHVNPFPLPLVMARFGRSHFARKKLVGYVAWELPEAPPLWREGMRYLDEIWVPSQFTAEAMMPIAGGRPVRVLHHPIAINDPFAGLAESRTANARFEVLSIFNMRSAFNRKNPLAAIAAFKRAFDASSDAHLTLKVVNGQDYPEGWHQLLEASAASNITLLDTAISRDALNRLIAQSDTLISLHRAEGFGLPVAEAMLAGVPPVSTDFSGTCDFLDARNGMPIPYTLIPAQDPQGEYEQPGSRWADPDISAAADALVRLRDDADLRQSLGRAARQQALKLFDPSLYADKVRQALAN